MEDIYREGQSFISFKKVLREMGPQYQQLELVSFHSVSKGFYGEYVLFSSFSFFLSPFYLLFIIHVFYSMLGVGSEEGTWRW